MNKILMVMAGITFSSCALAGGKLVDAAGVNLVKAKKVYSTVNLHPDNIKNLLYSVNYQLPSVIPMCSEVDILKISKKKMVFKLVDSGKKYTFAYHKKATPIPFAKYLVDFFASSCDLAAVSKLSEVDQEGVRLGRAQMGMSKEGVLLAMGRPPHHVNPELSAFEWIYWRHKFARTIITFDKAGFVTQIR